MLLLRSHCRDLHTTEFVKVEGSADEQGAGQPDIRIFGNKYDLDRQQREKVVLAFAQNGLPFRLIDDDAFRAAFGLQIPKKLDRKELASATQILRNNIECQLFRRYSQFGGKCARLAAFVLCRAGTVGAINNAHMLPLLCRKVCQGPKILFFGCSGQFWAHFCYPPKPKTKPNLGGGM